MTAQLHPLPILLCLKDIVFVNHLQILGVLESRVAMVLFDPTALKYITLVRILLRYNLF